MVATLNPRLVKPAAVDVFELLGDQATDFEMIRGELREAEPMGGRHGAIGGDLHIDIGIAVRAAELGQVFTSDTQYEVQREPRIVVKPDVSFVRHDRLPADEVWAGLIPLAPDLAVEIVSPSNREAEILEKVAIYLSFGTRLVWLARPAERTVTVFRPDSPERVLTEAEVLDGEDVIPGFRLPLTTMFRPRGR